MRKFKKIRGNKQIVKEIEKWKNYNLDLDLEYLKSAQRNYCKIWVSPFCDISIINSEFPSPKGKHRKLILDTLLEIFESWETKLKTLNEPYYLAIWLFEPRLEKSQVVCAIGDMLNFYESTFRRPEKQLQFPTQNYGKFKNKLDNFNWTYSLDEDYFTQDDIDMDEDSYASVRDFREYQKWYRRKLKQNPFSYKNDNGDTTYFYRHGTVWIGIKN